MWHFLAKLLAPFRPAAVTLRAGPELAFDLPSTRSVPVGLATVSGHRLVAFPAAVVFAESAAFPAMTTASYAARLQPVTIVVAAQSPAPVRLLPLSSFGDLFEGETSSDLEPLRDFLLDELTDELENFRGPESLDALFCDLLGYRRHVRPLSRRLFSKEVNAQVAKASLLARHRGFYVLLVEHTRGRLDPDLRDQLLRQVQVHFPAAAVVVTDPSGRRAGLLFAGADGTGPTAGCLWLSPLSSGLVFRARLLGRLRTDEAGGAARSRRRLLQAYRWVFAFVGQRNAHEDDLDPDQLFYRDVYVPRRLSDEEQRALLTALSGIGEVRQGPRRKVRFVPADRRDEYRQGRDRIACANLRLCLHFAKRYRRHTHSMSVADLMQEGVFGLYRAIDLFDPQRPNRFSTYAVHWIRQSIRRAIANTDRFVRIPAHHLDGEAGNGAAKEAHGRRMRSLDCGPSRRLRDRLIDPFDRNRDAEEAHQQAYAVVRDALRVLNDRQRAVIKWRFGIDSAAPMTLEEIGRLLGVTRERVRQIERQALDRLQARLVAD